MDKVKLKVIQQIPLEWYSIYLRGIDFESNTIYINGNPTKLKRSEKFYIDGDIVRTENYYFSKFFLDKFLLENDAVKEDGTVLSVCNEI